MICNRVSTIGHSPPTSALFFTGVNTDEERFTNLTNKRTGDKGTFLTVQRRDNWIKYIRQRIQQTTIQYNDLQKNQLKEWAKKETFDKIRLSSIIDYHSKHNKHP